MDANLFTHQTFLFRNERQELVTAMVSLPCQLSGGGQPHTGFSYINSNIGTPPALIPAYSYIPLQPMAQHVQPTAAGRTNDNMIGDLFLLGSNQQRDYSFQPLANNGVHFTRTLPVTTIHNSPTLATRLPATATSQATVFSVAKHSVSSTTSLNSDKSNELQPTLGPINVDSNNVTVLQSGRVVQDGCVEIKSEDDGVIQNGSRRPSAVRRRISSSSDDDAGGNYYIEQSTSSESDVIASSDSSSGEDSPLSNYQPNQLLYGDFGAYYNITCGDLSGQFYISRFARGSIGKCLLYKGVWHTPNSFQSIAGHQCSKDWKRSIRCGRQCLKDLIKEGKLQEHPKSCTCGICFSVADVAAARDLNSSSKINQVILAKKRRLSQTDSGKSRKPTRPTVSAMKMEEEVIINGDNLHVPVDLTEESTPVRRRNDISDSHSISADESSKTNSTSSEPQEPSTSEMSDPVSETTDPVSETTATENFKVPIGSPFHTEAGTFIKNPRLWNCEEVSVFLQQIGFPQLQDHFMGQDVDGQSLMMLNEGHLMETFHMKLGNALKFLEAVEKLKHPPG